VFVFAWTDEWHRGGHDILDWKFGLTTIERVAKPALDVVSRAFADTPFAMDRSWPRVSVVVCTHNGARTIGETLEALRHLEYPDEHWLMYLAHAFAHTKHAGIGGPNIAPEGDGAVAQAVSRSPGNATHVLVDDRLAEHLPGCNMAFRTAALREIGGFDPQFK